LPKKTFEAVAEAKGELITQIKENQGNLYKEIQEACLNLQPLSTFISPIEKARNRIEQREAAVFNVKHSLIESADWNQYIACIVQVKRYTEVLDTKNKTWKVRQETAYYAASHLHGAQEFASHIRMHWWIENKNHHVRDVTLKEDLSRIRKSPGIFARLRSFALNILRVNQVENVAGALFDNAINLDTVLNYQGVS
jgi:predicted transposase YbfD/YdcC